MSLPVTAGTHVVAVEEPAMAAPRRSRPVEVSVEDHETVVLEVRGGHIWVGNPKLRLLDRPRGEGEDG